MEAEYEKVLSWVDPGAGGASTFSTGLVSPWGEGIHIFGAIQPLKGCQAANLMADSYGFASTEELSPRTWWVATGTGWCYAQVTGLLLL